MTDELGQPATNSFDRRASVYGSGWMAYFWDFGRLLVDEVTVAPGAVALDVAAGTGAVALPLARRGARVLALDVSRSMLAQFPGATATFPIVRVLGSGQALPLPAASVDVVTCGFGIAFFPDLSGALAEMRRVLRPAGQLALTWWHFDVPTPWVEANRIIGALDVDGTCRLRRMNELADPVVVERHVRDAGFTSPRVRPFGLEWTEESVAAFRDARISIWERERSLPVPPETPKRLQAATAGWVASDGKLRYPLRAFAVLADGTCSSS